MKYCVSVGNHYYKSILENVDPKLQLGFLIETQHFRVVRRGACFIAKNLVYTYFLIKYHDKHPKQPNQPAVSPFQISRLGPKFTILSHGLGGGGAHGATA